MIPIVTEEIDRYIEDLFKDADPILKEMEAYGEKIRFPFVGPQVGRLLFLLTKLSGAKTIFEIGSGFGYSAYWFAKALPAAGKVIQTEFEEKNSKKSQDFFKRGGLLAKTQLLVGDGIEWIRKSPGDFDIIFLDLEKERYPAAFRLAKDRLKKGGLLVADNTLWFGQVLAPSEDPATQGIQEFNRLLFSDADFFATIVPIRDGVAIGYKSAGGRIRQFGGGQ